MVDVALVEAGINVELLLILVDFLHQADLLLLLISQSLSLILEVLLHPIEKGMLENCLGQQLQALAQVPYFAYVVRQVPR